MASSAKSPAARGQARSAGQPRRSSYWAANVRLIAALLLIWCAITFLPIVFVEQLNQIVILTGFPLGYYMGAQGSPLAFLILIAVYIWRIERLDQRCGQR